MAFEGYFRDRRDAGRRLAAELGAYRGGQAIVLALPRGGVPVGFEIAKALQVPLDLILVRKIGAPGQPELGIGALVDARPPQLVLSQEAGEPAIADPRHIEAERQRQLAEIERQRRCYLGDRAAADVAGKQVIVVDDGLATGGTAKAVLLTLAAAHPARLAFAVPLAPAGKMREMQGMADEFYCLIEPEPFHAVSVYYADFGQVSDAEVVALLAEARAWSAQGD